MARRKTGDNVTLEVTTKARPHFDESLHAFVYDKQGNLVERGDVKSGKLTLSMSPGDVARSRVFLVPASKGLTDVDDAPAPSRLQALGAFEPVLRGGIAGDLTTKVEIPGSILDGWPFCLCLVQGRVIRASDQRGVCGARVRICEVDRVPRWILELPDRDILKLRDDLLRPIPLPFPPEPRPDPAPIGPLPPEPPLPPGPGPDPAPFDRPLFRFDLERRSQMASTALPMEFQTVLRTSATPAVRRALVDNWRLLLPYLCFWPSWWRYRCDEVAVVTTDANGRFQLLLPYDCDGDKPDLYFRVEYDFGAGWETVYAPPLPCWTHWDYECGSEVVLRVSDSRVPGCSDEPDLDGKQVWVLSVGRTVSVGEILTSAAGADEGKAEEGFAYAASGSARFAFGGKLEPRVWFGRTALAADGIHHYLWSVRPLGSTESDWTPLSRQVIRHYTMPDGTAPVAVMGPEPAGANAGRFQIRPKEPPTGGIEWLVADEREDLASAHLETSAPPWPDGPRPSCGLADPRAGKYELKLELFDDSGARVAWEDEGITLRYATNEAPFGTDPVLTAVADPYHRITEAGKTVAFRMVLHVDNARCGGEVQPVSGTGIGVDPACGVVTLTGPAPTVALAFDAGRPGGLAHFRFRTERGVSTPVPSGNADGPVTTAAANGFTRSSTCTFTKAGLDPLTLLGGCDQGAFSERLHVRALTVDGYNRLSGLDASDVAAFMLTRPCPGAPGRGRGGGGGGA